MLLVVSYDIPDQKRRTRVHKALEGFGEPVQESVFECDLTKPQLDRMIKRLSVLIVEDEDRLRVYTLCQECREKVRIFGEGKLAVTEDFLFL